MVKRDDKRHKYALMMGAHRDQWIRFGRKQFTAQHNKDRAAIKHIFDATSTPEAARMRIENYLKTAARQGWTQAVRTVWVETGKASITYMHAFLTGKNLIDIAYKGVSKQDEEAVAALHGTWEDRVNADILAGGDKIARITDTEKDQVTKVLADGQDAGLGHYAIGQAVDSKLSETWPGRGETISRTEVNSAMNKATLQDAGASAPDLNKVWATTGMDNVREWHADADGQSVPQDEPFDVMGEDMDCPGDDDGSPENVINCACCLQFEPPEDFATHGEEGGEEAESEMGEGEGEEVEQPSEGEAPEAPTPGEIPEYVPPEPIETPAIPSEIPPIAEVSPEDQHVADVDKFIANRDLTPDKDFLTPHTPEELADHQILMMNDGTTGVAVGPTGEVVNLYNNSGMRGQGGIILDDAISKGANNLDCYDTGDHGLVPFYEKHGFVETSRVPFDPLQAPDDWNYPKLNNPDVVFMALNPTKGYKQEVRNEVKEKMTIEQAKELFGFLPTDPANLDYFLEQGEKTLQDKGEQWIRDHRGMIEAGWRYTETLL
jgi:hypothetical protein